MGLRRCLRRCGWCAGFGRRGEDEAFADQSEALLGKLGLEKLVFGAREEVRIRVCECGDEVVNGDGLAVEGSIFVGIGGELNGDDGAVLCAGLLGQYHPEVAVVLFDSDGEKRVEGAWVEIGKEHSGWMKSKASGRAAAVGRNIEQKLR